MIDFYKKASLLIYLLSLIFCNFSLAQGIRGKVTDDSGEPLGYASIFIRNLGDGIPTNQQGEFEYKLRPGFYDVVVQYMGYTSKVQTIEVKEEWVKLDFILEQQTYALQEVTINSKAEDPALTIMRKAISKAKFHRLQVDEYTMTVYLKGTGQLTNAPFFMKKELEKEGLKLNEAYTTESVSEITFRQPNTVEEKVISIRTNGDNNQTSPAPYIVTSFYQEKINEAISPLAPSAFAYYKFRFEGSFIENGYTINKIRVTPRSRGERVFEGHIFIIEDHWAIHSLDLKTSLLGFDIGVRQLYSEVATHVWMPTTHTYTFGGKFFGFAGEYKYLASARDHKVIINQDLIVDTKILDEKVQEIPKSIRSLDKNVSALEQMAQNDQLSRKDFRKLINEYEKEALKEREDVAVISNRSYKIDSLAKKRDLSYWDSIRPLKLTEAEIKGYQRDDSLAVVEAAKVSENDSLAKKSMRKFNPLDILTGGGYNFGKGRSAGFKSNPSSISFNTVEGYRAVLSGYYKVQKSEKMADSVTNHTRSWSIEPELRYGFSSKQFYSMIDIKRSVNKGRPGHTLGLKGGSYIFQYNADNPINELVNSLYSFFLRQNYMKLFEQDFATLYFAHRISDAFTYRSSITYADRRSLSNNTDFSLYNRDSRNYTDNIPENIETMPDNFENNKSLIWKSSISWRPGVKYQIRNGRKIPLLDSAPLVNFSYTKGIKHQRSIDHADFDLLEGGIEHFFNFGVSGKLDFNLKAGTFINNNKVYFQDFVHFGGNRTIFANMGVASNYRFLDYYQYSTSSEYVSGIVHYQFRKFLLTQLPMLRFTGLRENLFFNYLKTANSPHYWEVGYSLDNLFRVFRIEMGAGFENNNFNRGGVRLGIASFITIN
ncbi:DUF5686 and carboxypeptidase regulatory-like domain-containing protein [Belliella kenyensis]|uniref:DUF5686 and carboxypeptidase regulatory-like domain-containing protein n=2 Tax=Belliella kenyensis TaxID=1472724 RepID=A0ABV8ESN5_9BACT|nr:DUF5686 and carboxypeptidase regulatory-like domain-containing protein [Belliella kenyensis]MCH7402794.1 DUF5686 and carboxypeptidase regulatory-like domain-containing protein [Belliella kenyensis]MDN3602500.1 DUF5686 and carboxypeptidase regulatory-like domain-containing protein [Belliella kenyensis]